jgi:lipid-A-disaccharide synthase
LSTNILIVAGEVSGDLHAAPVVEELKRLRPELSFYGAGGERLRVAGVELLDSVERLAVMGFSDLPRVLPRLARLKRELLRRAGRDRTRLAILTDYPGFNLNLAQALKRLPNPPRILYYIAPQVWAWRPGRVKLIRQVVDRLAVVFPFEEPLFRDAGVPVSFVGHPLMDEMRDLLPPLTPPLLSRGGRGIEGGASPLLALLPGSRRQEVERLLPTMIIAAARLRLEMPELQVAVGCAPNLSWKERVASDGERESGNFNTRSPLLAPRSLPAGSGGWLEWRNDARKLLSEADAAAVCSGTATLEAALLGTPQVVVYRTSGLNYAIARRFVTLKSIALVNVVAGERVAAELLQDNLTPERLTAELRRLLTGDYDRSGLEAGYAKVRQALGTPGAARRVAELAAKLITN